MRYVSPLCRRILGLLVLGFLILPFDAHAQDRFRRALPADRIPDQYIVILEDSTASDAVPSIAQQMAVQYRGQVRLLFQNAVRGFSATLTEAQAIELSKDSRVKLVEENAKAYLSSEQVLPNDDSLWALDRVDQKTPISTGNDRYRYCEKASSVTAYVLDTGINKNHQEFLKTDGTSRVLNGVNFSGDYFAWPGEANDYGTYPCGAWTDNYLAGHGTSVASIIGGKTLGIAKEVRLVPLRVFTCQGTLGSVEQLCWALDWIKSASNPNRNSRPALVNISLRVATTQPFVGAFESVINGVVLDSPGWTGITVVASANNQNTDVACSTPARMAYRNTAFISPGRVISVGGTQQNDTRWQCSGGECFLEYGCSGLLDTSAASNYGAIVDIYAPAHNVASAHIACSSCRRMLPTTTSGTSFSSAIVSGIVARILQANPTWTPLQVWNEMQAKSTKVVPPIDPVNGNNMLAYRSGSAVCVPELP